MCDVVSQIGCRWDASTGKFAATDTHLSETNKEAGIYRLKGCADYGLLHAIVGDPTTLGSSNMTLTMEGLALKNIEIQPANVEGSRENQSNQNRILDGSDAELDSFGAGSFADNGKGKKDENGGTASNATYISWNDLEDATLLNLLYEEVLKGNRCPSGWKKEVWPRLMETFQELTGFTRTKAHVIHSMRNWRRNYKKVSDIVSKSGFRWDAITGKIVATDSRWDELIETNKDAEFYRDNGCPSYGILQAVVGDLREQTTHEMFSGKEDSANNIVGTLQTNSEDVVESRIGNDVCPENSNAEADSAAAVLVPYQFKDKEDENEVNTMKGPYNAWTADEDKAMMNLLYMEVLNGNKLHGGWKKDVWPKVMKAFHEQTGSTKSKEHVINHMRTWKRKYKKVSDVIANSGFRWDASTRKLMATDSEWEALIKRNNEAEFYGFAGCPNYGQLQAIVGDTAKGTDTMILGEDALGGKDVQVQAENIGNVVETPVDLNSIADTLNAESGAGLNKRKAQCIGTKRRCVSPMSHCSSRQKITNGSDDCLERLDSAIERLVDYMTKDDDGWLDVLAETPDLDLKSAI